MMKIEHGMLMPTVLAFLLALVVGHWRNMDGSGIERLRIFDWDRGQG